MDIIIHSIKTRAQVVHFMAKYLLLSVAVFGQVTLTQYTALQNRVAALDMLGVSFPEIKGENI